MNRIKAIIFDLDGTLIDSVTDLANSVNYTLEKLSLPLHTTEEIKSYVGDGVQKLIKRSLGQAHMEKFTEAFACFMAHYALHCTDSTVLYPKVAETLPYLAENYSLGILTNKSVTFSPMPPSIKTVLHPALCPTSISVAWSPTMIISWTGSRDHFSAR